ncbi:MAG: biopolymer transporter ExbD [Phycisphaeraceae bacterium]
MNRSASNPIEPAEPGDRLDGVIRGRFRSQSQAAKAIVGGRFELKLTSMIDVVFLLLVFFVVTATFTHDEGTLLATMPGEMDGESRIHHPINVELTSADDGISYHLTVDGRSIESATALAQTLSDRVRRGQMAIDDPVQINPQGVVRWQHVVNVFNACVSAELERVAFAR